MSRNPYIVVSAEDDDTIPFVQKHLDEPLLLLNTRHILKGNTNSYHVNDGQTTVEHDGRPLSGIRSVWYRRYMLVQQTELPVGKEKQLYAKEAITYFNRLLFAQFSDALWINDFFAVERADDKLWQLQVAARVGFNVPDTLFTADPQKAYAFVQSHKHVIAKPNYSAVFQQDGANRVFYTSRVDTKTDFKGFNLAPAILQQAIDIKTELRITVVGDQVFAASVHDNSEYATSRIRDWRVGSVYNEVTFTAFELPAKLRQQCVDVVRELGLVYGAIDAIIDPHDKLWFLENNPNGQWSFIESATEQQIGKAHADMMMTAVRK